MYSIALTARGVRYAAIAAIVAALALIAPLTMHAQVVVNSNLAEGSSGADVTALQQYLAQDSSIYPEGLVTGYFGPLTRAAVMRFQARYGISQVGMVGPITRGQMAQVALAGSTPGTPNTGAESAPIMSAPSVTPAANSAVISWSTNEPAASRVMYGTSWPFLYASAPSVASSGGMSQNASVTLTGLSPHTTYYYTRESMDADGNVMWTVNESFTTTQ